MKKLSRSGFICLMTIVLLAVSLLFAGCGEQLIEEEQEKPFTDDTPAFAGDPVQSDPPEPVTDIADDVDESQETTSSEPEPLDDEKIRYDVISIEISMTGPSLGSIFLKNSEINRFLDVFAQFDFSEPIGVGGGTGVAGAMPCFIISTEEEEYAVEYSYSRGMFAIYPKNESFTLKGRENCQVFDFSKEFAQMNEDSLLALKMVADKALSVSADKRVRGNEYDLIYPWGEE